MAKVLDLPKIKQSLANLDRIAAEHPEILGRLTMTDLEASLSEKSGTSTERQRRLKQKRLAAGIKPNQVWLSDADIDALKSSYPGPKGGIDWAKVIQTALEPQAQSDNAEIEQLQRKVHSLEKAATETAKRHKDDINEWRKLVDALEAQRARLEADLRNPGRRR